jgi:hypothetical protein
LSFQKQIIPALSCLTPFTAFIEPELLVIYRV